MIKFTNSVNRNEISCTITWVYKIKHYTAKIINYIHYLSFKFYKLIVNQSL